MPNSSDGKTSSREAIAEFGAWVGQAAVDPDVVWAKFAAMAEGARIASKRFWS